MKNIILIIMISSFVFCAGFFSAFLQIFPYKLIKNAYLLTKVFAVSSSDTIKMSTCELPKLKEVPLNSIAIIGHAYGSPHSRDTQNFLANSVDSFLEKNSNRLDTVIFSGDVFLEPSIAKWERLSNKFINDFKIEIAPGNHDIGLLSSKDIFKMTDFIYDTAKVVRHSENEIIILEDSVSTNYLLAPKTKALLKQSYNKNIFLIRHHIPTKELVKYANEGHQRFNKLPSTHSFINEFPKDSFTTIIIGDGGAFKHLPREKCLEINNFKVIINGIGELPGDTVLLFNNGLLYSFEI